MRALVVGCVLAAAAFGGDADWNGRWNLKVEKEPKARAWWLEVQGAGSAGPLRGRFVGAPGGDMNTIEDLALKGGVLTFSFARQGNQLRYEVRQNRSGLTGTRTGDGHVFHFTGKRAPEIADRDDGSWKKGRPVALFNGRDLSGWKASISSKELGWVVRDGVLSNVAGANNLESSQRFWNFELDAEYRLREHTNSGIGLRGRYEIQILEDYGKEPNTHNHGALYSRIAPAVNATRPVGEWQTLHVRLVGRTLTVVLNGKTVLERVTVEGLTAMATDADEAAPGPITIQGDHREVEFRKLSVTPLTR